MICMNNCHHVCFHRVMKEKQAKSKWMLLGDFIYDLMKTASSNWTQLRKSFSFRQKVTEPTRVTPTSLSLIDHILNSLLIHRISLQ